MKEIVFTENAPEPAGPYSQAVLSNGTLYCSGQIALGHLDEGISEQTEYVCQNVKAVLAAAGMELSDVIKTTCFLAEMADFAVFNEAYGKYFPHRPARSCVAVKELPKNALVEIEVIAVKD
ncbi:MAG: regulator [Clostridiales bacterium]|nr:regulator [Clostridiales bacterium]